MIDGLFRASHIHNSALNSDIEGMSLTFILIFDHDIIILQNEKEKTIMKIAVAAMGITVAGHFGH